MINLKEKQFLNSKTEPTKPTKEELTNQKLQLQIELLQQKKNQQTQKIQQQEQKKSKLQTARGIIKILIAICGVLLAPFVILGGFLLACAKAAK